MDEKSAKKSQLHDSSSVNIYGLVALIHPIGSNKYDHVAFRHTIIKP